MKRFAVACVLVALCSIGVASRLHATGVSYDATGNGAGGDASPDSAAVANTTVSSDPVYCYGASSVTFFISGTGAGTDTLISAQYSNDEGAHWSSMIAAVGSSPISGVGLIGGGFPVVLSTAANTALNVGPKTYTIAFVGSDLGAYGFTMTCPFEAIRIQTKAGYVAPVAHTIRWAAVYPQSNWNQSTQPVPTR